MKISDDLIKEFTYLNAIYYADASSKTGTTRDDKLKKATSITKIITRLKTPGFINGVMTFCMRLFHRDDPEFEEKLDSNKNLIGFNNGVYDLESLRFRAGTPDDYISLTVGYDWEDYTLDHEYIKEIQLFFSKVQTDEDMREYVLALLASYLALRVATVG